MLDEALPPGLLANAAAVLATAVGKRRPEVVGADLLDAADLQYLGMALCGDKTLVARLTGTLPLLR